VVQQTLNSPRFFLKEQGVEENSRFTINKQAGPLTLLFFYTKTGRGQKITLL